MSALDRRRSASGRQPPSGSLNDDPSGCTHTMTAVQLAPTAEEIDAETEQAEADAGIERDQPESTEPEGSEG